MKNFAKLTIVFAIALSMSGCAYVASPLMGAWYTDVKSPVAVTSNTNSSKVGSAGATSILGLVATGDASIDAAAKAAGISTIHHVDQHATNILGIYATYTIFVYGE